MQDALLGACAQWGFPSSPCTQKTFHWSAEQ